MTVSPDDLREAMSHFATGVTVVAGVDEGAGAVGFTANAVCSVSLEPPLILVCADKESLSLATVLDTGRFSVSILSAADADVARRFSAGAREDRFRDVAFTRDKTALPVLANAIAWIGCAVWRSVDAGDHIVVFGEVLDCGTRGTESPLVFFRGHFGTVTDVPPFRDG